MDYHIIATALEVEAVRSWSFLVLETDVVPPALSAGRQLLHPLGHQRGSLPGSPKTAANPGSVWATPPRNTAHDAVYAFRGPKCEPDPDGLCRPSVSLSLSRLRLHLGFFELSNGLDQLCLTLHKPRFRLLKGRFGLRQCHLVVCRH